MPQIAIKSYQFYSSQLWDKNASREMYRKFQGFWCQKYQLECMFIIRPIYLIESFNKAISTCNICCGSSNSSIIGYYGVNIYLMHFALCVWCTRLDTKHPASSMLVFEAKYRISFSGYVLIICKMMHRTQ